MKNREMKSPGFTFFLIYVVTTQRQRKNLRRTKRSSNRDEAHLSIHNTSKCMFPFNFYIYYNIVLSFNPLYDTYTCPKAIRLVTPSSLVTFQQRPYRRRIKANLHPPLLIQLQHPRPIPPPPQSMPPSILNLHGLNKRGMVGLQDQSKPHDKAQRVPLHLIHPLQQIKHLHNQRRCPSRSLAFPSSPCSSSFPPSPFPSPFPFSSGGFGKRPSKR